MGRWAAPGGGPRGLWDEGADCMALWADSPTPKHMQLITDGGQEAGKTH